MNKIKSFCNNNKPFVIVASVFVLLGMVFNDKLVTFSNNLTSQAAQLIAFAPPVVIPPPSIQAPPYFQYPSLSNSGFFIETRVTGSLNYPKAIAGTEYVMNDTMKDSISLINDYYISRCTSVACTEKLNTLLNSLYTYASYATAYSRLSYESTNGSLNNDTDWAGIAESAVVATIKSASVNNANSLMSQIRSRVQMQFGSAVSMGGTFKYTSPLASETSKGLSSLLKLKEQAFRSINYTAPPTTTTTAVVTSATSTSSTRIQRIVTSTTLSTTRPVVGAPNVTTAKNPTTTSTTTATPATKVSTAVAPSYIDPYLIVFGSNPLGYLDFKVIRRSSVASSGYAGAYVKFGQINGSLGEVDTTMSNLRMISSYAGEGVLIYAGMGSEMNKVQFETVTTSYPTNISSGSGSGSGLGEGTGSGLATCSAPGFPFSSNSTVGTTKEVSLSSIKVLEQKLVKFANNQSALGLKPKGETGVNALVLTNGKVLAVLTLGEMGSVNGKLSDVDSYIINNKGCIDFVYTGHTHDKNSTSYFDNNMWCCMNYPSQKIVGQSVTVPSETDLMADVLYRNNFDPIPLIDRVFAPSGYGWEYSVPKKSKLWNRLLKKRAAEIYDNSSEEELRIDAMVKVRNASMKSNGHIIPKASQEDDKAGSLVGISILRTEWGVILKEIIPN